MENEEVQSIGGIASLLQLTAKGPENDYINANELDFFKKEFNQHTPFIIHNENIQMYVNFDKKYNVEIPIYGDFIKDIFMHFELPVNIPSHF
jgi:hypothetical protein